MNPLIEVETLVLELLLIVSIVAIAVRRFRIPYTVALVLVGAALSLRSSLDVQLTPDLILFIFLPPLVFEAAFHLNLDELRRNLPTIALLAVPGVVFNMLVVGGLVAFGAQLPLSIALVFGALIAATDPVAVVAIFRKLGAPKRLEVLLEGESLLNDGTAIVIFNLAVAAVLGGAFNLLNGVLDFLIIGGGGLVVGMVLGWLISRLMANIDDHLVETTLTTVLAFGSYLVAEEIFHVSGVLAVVAAGLVNGNIGPRGMSPTTRIVVFNFWEYVTFLANSAVFLLIGWQLELPVLLENWRPILWAIGAVLFSRAIVIYVFSRLGRAMPGRWRHVLFWGGLRGAIALALALSLPHEMGEARQLVTVMTFGVVLFTLLGQGMSMGWLVERLGLIVRGDAQIEYERRHARALAARAAMEHLQRLKDDGLISSYTWEKLRPVLKERVEALTAAVQEALDQAPELEAEELVTARREALRAQRSMLSNLRRDGVISDRTYEELVAEVDMALDTGLDAWAERAVARGGLVHANQLMAVVVQAQDLESATNALAVRGFTATRIQSRGGFLKQSNHLLLVGVPEGRLEEAVEALRRTCRTRVEYLSTPMEGLNIPMPVPVPVEVKGATVFVFKIDRHEVI